MKLAAFVLVLAAASASPTAPAAQNTLPPPSLQSVGMLYNRIPDLPQTAREAATWVDKNGTLVHPGMLALRADIAAHQQAIAQIQSGVAERHRDQSAIATENLGKGLADAGIDMARMQSDPAYAEQVQARLQKMTPQELIALSQKMSAPLNQDKRYQNQAQAMVDDPPYVRAAAEAGQAYTQTQMTRLNAQLDIWREADEAVQRVLKKPLVVAKPKPAMEWDNIGCDAGCRAQWDAYAQQMLPLMVARDGEVLRVQRAALMRHRAAVATELRAADRHLAGSQYGALSNSQVNQGAIAAYDGAVIGEISQLLDRITDSVKRAAVVVHCGPQIVLVPGAVCR